MAVRWVARTEDIEIGRVLRRYSLNEVMAKYKARPVPLGAVPA